MAQTAPLTANQIRDLGTQLAQLLTTAGVTVDPAAAQAALPALLTKLGIAQVGHTCTTTGKPLPYGRLAPEGECPRCDERRAEKAEGIAARPAPAWTERAQRHQDNNGGYPSNTEIRDHFAPGGPHARGACRPVCTFGDY